MNLIFLWIVAAKEERSNYFTIAINVMINGVVASYKR
jgi:hypothetical protein